MFKKISILIAVLFVIYGCGNKEVKKNTGFTFTSMHRPVRIISTVPSNTEILFALGLGDRIVGVTSQCNYPPAAKKIQKIGGANLNAEKIIALNPDLVLMLGDAQMNDIERLRCFQLPVFVINPRDLNGLISSIRLIGKITGSQKEAEALAKKISDDMRRVSLLKRAAARPKVFVVLWDDPLITAGKGTFIDNLITAAGGKNIASGMKGKYPIMSLETLIEEDPDYLVIAGKSKDDIKKLKDRNAWKLLKAVKENKILLIDSDIITRPSPRLITALDLISGFIRHQEAK